MNNVLDSLRNLDSPTWIQLGEYGAAFEKALKEADEANAARRVWGREGSLWSEDQWMASNIEERLGWLDLPQSMRIEIPRLKALAAEIRAADIQHVILLGMGGSSLAAEVMGRILGDDPDHPSLTILDSTDPSQIRRTAQKASLARTLFIVASKSGTTAETRNLYTYFKHAMREEVGEERWGSHFIAVTDPGTPLAEIAKNEGFRTFYLNPTDIGGRYSALSFFGLVPASLVGIDLDELLRQAKDMAWSCRAAVAAENNPGLVLGAIMGGLARHPSEPHDKLTLITSPRVAPFGPWTEQLLAESTGKEGVGILPIEREPARPAAEYGRDRLFVYVRLATDDNEENDARIAELIEEGHPVVVSRLPDIYGLGAEFFRWEFATAVAGYLLGINPFNQPNVEAAKTQARNALSEFEETEALPEFSPVLETEGFEIYGSGTEDDDVATCLASFLSEGKADDYIAILAYLERNDQHFRLLQEMRRLLGEKTGLATTVGFGPRYLHSTGQLHKGGKNNGLFLEITYTPEDDLAIPEKEYTFGILKRAQALGELEALREEDRRVMRIQIDQPLESGLRELTQIVRDIP
jgi:glucose-6-phosphate isomerase